MYGSCVTGSPQSEFSDRFSNRDEGTEQPEWRCILPRAKHQPTQQACRVAVEDRSAGFAQAVQANPRIHATGAARQKHICASS